MSDRTGGALEAGLGWILLGATVLSAALLGLWLVWPAGPLAAAGVTTLLAAPFAAIVAAAALYGRAGEWRLVATAVLLLAILAAGLWLQAGR